MLNTLPTHLSDLSAPPPEFHASGRPFRSVHLVSNASPFLYPSILSTALGRPFHLGPSGVPMSPRTPHTFLTTKLPLWAVHLGPSEVAQLSTPASLSSPPHLHKTRMVSPFVWQQGKWANAPAGDVPIPNLALPHLPSVFLSYCPPGCLLVSPLPPDRPPRIDPKWSRHGVSLTLLNGSSQGSLLVLASRLSTRMKPTLVDLEHHYIIVDHFTAAFLPRCLDH